MLQSRNQRYLLIAIVVLVCAIYARSLGGSSGLDFGLITSKKAMLDPSGWSDLFFQSHAFPLAETNEYRPLTYLSFWIQVQAHGFSRFWFQFANLLLHIGNTLLLFSVLKYLAPRSTALWATAIFALHPIATEAVANISGRADLLACIFALGGWSLDLRSRGALHKPALRFLVVAMIAAAALSKENGIAILAPMFFADVFALAPKARAGIAAATSRHLAYAFGIIIALAVRFTCRGFQFYPQAPSIIDNPLVISDSPIFRLVTAVWVQVRALGLLVFPSHLSPDYSFNQIPLIGSWTDWRILVVVAFTLLISLFTIIAIRDGRSKILFTLVSYFALIFVTSNFLVTIGTIFGERTLYMPSMIFSFGLALILTRMQRDRSRATQLTILLLFLVPLAGRTWFRNQIWASDHNLLEARIRDASNSARTWLAAGHTYLRDGQTIRAMEAVNRGLRIAPEWWQLWLLKASVLSGLNESEQATSAFAQAVLTGERGDKAIDEAIGGLSAQGRYGEARQLLDHLLQEGDHPIYAIWRAKIDILDGCPSDWIERLHIWRDANVLTDQSAAQLASLVPARERLFLASRLRADSNDLANPLVRLFLANLIKHDEPRTADHIMNGIAFQDPNSTSI